MTDKIKIFFVDDDVALGNIVVTALQEEGYEVYFQNSLAMAKIVATELKFDLLIIDVEIGNEDGINAIPAFLDKSPDMPILVVSSHIETQEVVRALTNGALIYIRKPFEIDELIAYINRYAKPATSVSLSISSLTLNLQTRILSQGTKELKRLSKLEFALLCLFNEHRNKVLSLDEISQVWGQATFNEHSLYNYVLRLRSLLEIDSAIMLSTERGYGYCMHVW